MLLIGPIALPDMHLNTVCKVFEMDHLSMGFLIGKVVIQCRKKLRRLEPKSGDDDFHIGQGDVSLTPFHAAHIAAVQAAVIRKALLREPLRFPKLPNHLAKGH